MAVRSESSWSCVGERRQEVGREAATPSAVLKHGEMRRLKNVLDVVNSLPANGGSGACSGSRMSCEW